MRFTAFQDQRGAGLAVRTPDGSLRTRRAGGKEAPGALADLIAAGPEALAAAHKRLVGGEELDESAITWLPPLPAPGKIICVGLNFLDHSAESGYAQPNYPTLFGRFASTLVAHRAPIVRPRVSSQLDYEGEIVAVIGRRGRHIERAAALSHVAGYSLFNDASIRDFQFKTPQWTVGKNFDGTGAFGPDFVTADELPRGVRGLRLQTRLNGEVLQDAATDDLVFDIEQLISIISEAITLEPGDLIVTGTPAGIGNARDPQLWMKPGDICEVEVEGIGLLSNPIADEPAA